MKLRLYILFFGITIFFAGIINVNAHSCMLEEEDENHLHNFRNVDVEIKYKGNGVDYYENVDVFDKTNEEKPCLGISHKDPGRSEIVMLVGVRVHIYDHDTGELLEIYYSCK